MDMLSPKITLYFRRNNTHSSGISGILTIITYILILYFVIIYFLRYIKRENPTIYSFKRFVKDAGSFSFSDFNFLNYVQLTKMGSRIINEIDFNKIEIIGINMSIDTFNSGNQRIYPHWIYGKCDTETNIEGIKDLINTETFYKSACIKKFYNQNKSKYFDINDKNFEWPIIKHGASHPNFTYYGVLVRRCQNSSFRIENFGECSSDKEINEYLNLTFLSFYVVDHYIDVLNYKNPISKFLYSVTNKLEIDSYITNNLYFNPALIKSHDILFNNDINEQVTYSFHQNSKSFSPIRDSNLLGIFFLWLQNTQQYYERHYQKFSDMLSEIGGLGTVIILIAQCFNYFFFSFSTFSDTQILLSYVMKYNNSRYENMRQRKDINKLFEENINNQNEDDNNLRIYDREQKNIKIININNSGDSKNDDDNINKIISKRINVINYNNFREETNRMNKNEDNSDNKNISCPKSEAFEEIKTKTDRNYLNLERIKKKSSVNCFDYLCYLIQCKKIHSQIKYYEDFRKIIISEESMIKNYLNINKLFEFNQFNQN